MRGSDRIWNQTTTSSRLESTVRHVPVCGSWQGMFFSRANTFCDASLLVEVTVAFGSRAAVLDSPMYLLIRLPLSKLIASFMFSLPLQMPGKVQSLPVQPNYAYHHQMQQYASQYGTVGHQAMGSPTHYRGATNHSSNNSPSRMPAMLNSKHWAFALNKSKIRLTLWRKANIVQYCSLSKVIGTKCFPVLRERKADERCSDLHPVRWKQQETAKKKM